MKIAIAILNWNGASLLRSYLPEVIAHSEGADIWVIDNASEDDSVKLLRSEYPQVKVVRNTQNLGFAGGYNEGLKSIEADIYCLLNSDVSVRAGWLEPILPFFEKQPEVGIVQPKILDLKSPEHFEYAGAGGGFLDVLGYPFCRGRIFQSLEQDKGQYDDTRQIFWATGACMFIRSELFWKLGGFDVDYFAHQEEIDLCWRAQNEGHKVYYLGSTQVYHLGGSTLSNMNPRKTFLNFRNSLYSITKNLPRRRTAWIVIIRLVLDMVAGIRFVLQFKPAHFLAIIKAHVSYYMHLGTMLRKRRKSDHLKKYYHTKSIVWSHYVLGIREFNFLVKD